MEFYVWFGSLFNHSSLFRGNRKLFSSSVRIKKVRILLQDCNVDLFVTWCFNYGVQHIFVAQLPTLDCCKSTYFSSEA